MMVLWADDLTIIPLLNSGRLKNEFKLGMKLPSKELAFITMTRNDDKQDELLVSGYIDVFFGKSEMRHVEKLSYDLIKLIQSMLCFEKVHVIAYNHFEQGTDHWIIDVDCIIESQQKFEF